MIPYIDWHSISLGPLEIQVWGLFVAAGILCGLFVSIWFGKQKGIDKDTIIDMAFWIIVAALIGARVFYVVTEWQIFQNDLISVFYIWEGGASVTGGFIGATLAAWLMIRRRELSFLPTADALIFGLPLGLWIGRLGCFFIYDHPGKLTDFFLGQEYIDGIVRHNNGLYLSINGAVLALAFYLLHRKKQDRPAGTYLWIFLVCYGIVRFFLDFLRAAPGDTISIIDSRLLGLTAAQYVAVAMIVLGGYVWYATSRKQ